MKLKNLLILFVFLFSFSFCVFGQAVGFSVDIVTVYSQNGDFYLKTIPYDNEFPTLRGKTLVYKKGNPKPIYEFQRGFDSLGFNDNFLILSNDGTIIIYVISYGEDEQTEGLKSINIYKNGKITNSFTASEITGCDLKKERCDLVYYNHDEVIDEEKSNWGTAKYKQVFKDGISEQEKFLADFSLFSFDDVVYLTDSKKNTHLFDLQNGNLIKTAPF